MDVLGRIFGGKIRVKMLRLFLMNPERIYGKKQIAVLVYKTEKEVEGEIRAFQRAGLIRRRVFFEYSKKYKVSKQVRKAKTSGWILNGTFPYLEELRNLIINTVLVKNSDLIKRLGKAANLKMIVISGIFIRKSDSRVDILVVGEKIKKGKMERIIRSIESEIGKELKYTLIDVPEFRYRMSVGDRLVRDIFDYPHRVVLDKMGVNTS